MIRYFYLLFLAEALSSCSSDMHACPSPAAGDVVYVVEQGWHAEIGIPVEELDEHLAFYRQVFSGARVILFGYGKKTFFTAPPKTYSEYLLGPFPGPAVIHTVGLRVSPSEAYSPEVTTILRLPPGSSRRLSEFIWNDLAKDTAGKPQIIARSSNPDGQFYAAVSGYNLLHTCNSWTADALHETGLPVSGEGVIFSGQVVARVDEAVKEQCQPLFGN